MTRRLVATLALVLAASGAAAQSESLPARVSFGYERVALPGGERMGLASLSETVEVDPGWWVGGAVYGAASGQRGGLFTWGAEVQRRWRLAPRVELGAGLYLGAGGGAVAPVGGGLMLRPHADAWWALGDGVAAGVSWSQVRFPSGEIRGSQLGLQLAFDHRVRFTAPGATQGVGDGLGMTRGGLVVGRYTTANASGSLAYVGARALWALGDNVASTVDVLGAAGGGADGFAEITGGLLGVWQVLPRRAAIGVHGQLGLAGGGAVPTGGGTIMKASLLGAVALGRWQATLQAGRARSFGGSFDSRFVQASVDTAFGDERLDPLRDTTLGFTVQRWPTAQRKDGTTDAITNIGFKLRRDIDGPLFLSASAHSAAAGKAGAFSVGLVGAGAAWKPAPAWRVGVEASAGAAGGGGIDNGGGALAQAGVFVERSLGRHSQLEVGVGRVKSLRGALSTTSVEVGYNVAFGLR